MNAPSTDHKSNIQEDALTDVDGQKLIDAFDAGFEAGQDDIGKSPLVTPNPHEPRTALFYNWALGHEHGNL